MKAEKSLEDLRQMEVKKFEARCEAAFAGDGSFDVLHENSPRQTEQTNALEEASAELKGNVSVNNSILSNLLLFKKDKALTQKTNTGFATSLSIADERISVSLCSHTA